METVFIGFGSNQGDSVEICRQAIDCLERHPQIHVLKVSSLYRTEPVGAVEQDWFVNGIVQIETSLGPEELLGFIHEIETDFGRVRKIRWGPRTLDLDILSYGEKKIFSANLAIPHPGIHQRRFVLVPLVEIAPDWIHPTLKLKGSELLDRLTTIEGQAIHSLKG